MRGEEHRDDFDRRGATLPPGAKEIICSDFEAFGRQTCAFLKISEDLLNYFRGLLRGETTVPPKASFSDWADLLALLRPHKIIPFLYWRLLSLPEESSPPEPIRDQMRRAFLGSVVRAVRTERQLFELHQAFRQKGLRFLVMRGPALACSIYPEPGLRPGTDLDLLLPREEVSAAREVLENEGYRCLSKRFEAGESFFREEEFVHRGKPGERVPIDLHWTPWELYHFFENPPGEKLEDLFARAFKVESSGLTFETFDPVDALIQTVVHIALIHRRDARLIWVVDVALLAGMLSNSEDWEVLQNRSVAWNGRLALERCLRMAQAWTGLRLPQEFEDFARWPPPTENERILWEQTTRGHWTRVLLKQHSSSLPGLLKIGPSLWSLLFPSPRMIRLCYPPSRHWLLPLSYMRRWHRWFRELVLNRPVR